MIELNRNDIHASLEKIKSCISSAYNNYYQSLLYEKERFNEPEIIAEHYMERAFIQLVVLTEILGLKKVRYDVNETYLKAKSEGLLKDAMGIEESYLFWADKIEAYVEAIAIGYNITISKKKFTSDLEAVIRASLYTITDSNLFGKPPSSEADVHDRIESILKCIFPKLKHKPRLTKPIKNFEPDTGIPSIKTLIEYKYLSKKQIDKKIVDEILADTRGYYSRDWDQFLYVIYEEERFRAESEWDELLKECGVENNTKVIVLPGVSVTN